MNAPYVFIMDDDVIPDQKWLEYCMEVCDTHNAIVSPVGRIIPKKDYFPELLDKEGKFDQCFIGNSENNILSNCPQDTFVDFGCNSWFFKREWLHDFWALKPFTYDTGEDMHFSAACSIKGRIRTICPKQVESGVIGNKKMFYGFDEIASFKQENFIEKRSAILHYLIDDCQWRPLKW